MEHENYVRLNCLLQYARDLLEKHLAQRWKTVFGEEMTSEAIKCFLSDTGSGKRNFTGKLNSLQQDKVQQPSSSWDISLLALFLRSDPFRSAADVEPLKDVTSVRNGLAHGPSFHVNNEDFSAMWQKLETACYHFNGFRSSDEIATIKTAPVDDLTGRFGDEEDLANSLKDQGNRLYAQGKYEEAAMVYTDAMK